MGRQLLNDVPRRLINMKLLTKATIIFDRAINLSGILASILLAFVTLGVSADVMTRYITGTPIIWMYPISTTALLWVPFLGAAWLLREDGHVGLDIIIDRLPPKPQAVINLITSTLMIIVCAVLVWLGTKVTWDQFQLRRTVIAAIEMLTAIPLIVIPIGSFMLFIQSLRRTHGYLKRYRELRTDRKD